MSRYDGYSDPLEVMVEVLRELKKITGLLESKGVNDNDNEHKPKNTITRERSNRSSRNHAK